nr:MAG TPA_asm: hypothetical protein [Caudoviricetes sp.]
MYSHTFLVIFSALTFTDYSERSGPSSYPLLLITVNAGVSPCSKAAR